MCKAKEEALRSAEAGALGKLAAISAERDVDLDLLRMVLRLLISRAEALGFRSEAEGGMSREVGEDSGDAGRVRGACSTVWDRFRSFNMTRFLGENPVHERGDYISLLMCSRERSRGGWLKTHVSSLTLAKQAMRKSVHASAPIACDLVTDIMSHVSDVGDAFGSKRVDLRWCFSDSLRLKKLTMNYILRGVW